MDMKRIAVVVGAALLVLWVLGKFVASSPHPNAASAASTNADQPITADRWVVKEDKSPMDDSRTVVLSLESEDVIQGPLGAKRPSLIIRCQEGKTDTYVVTRMAASVEEDYDGGPRLDHTVKIRFDDGNAIEERWDESGAHDALFIGADGKEFVRTLAHTQRLTFQFTPFNANPAIARFDLRGLDAHLGRVADACRWTSN
ncbi:MAG: type VI secretion system-associated protein TagO [Candidatus Acidiferrales bacterium]